MLRYGGHSPYVGARPLPLGIAQGLPQTVQIIGPRYQEMACLDAAEAIERSLGVITPIDPVAQPEPTAMARA